MKNPKVVKHKETGLKAFFSNKRNWLVSSLVLIILFLFSVAMPMANIPGFGRLGAILGLTPDSMRYLTLSDLVAYAAGVDGNKVSIAQTQFYSAYESVGGLSPFSIVSQNRLFNAREAYLKEYQATGIRPNTVDGPLSKVQYPGSDVGYDGVSLTPPGGVTPIIDVERIKNSEYGESYGNPIGKLAQGFDPLGLSGVALGSGSTGGSGTRMTLPVKPAGAGNIQGMAKSDSSFKKGLEGSVDKLKGGRLGAMGGLNAYASRVSTRVGAMGQMGVFDTMGRSYFYSFNAKRAGYKTSAKTLAEAAFDGEEPAAESLITPGEEQEVILDTLEPPNTVIDKANGGISRCGAARKGYEQSIQAQYDAMKNLFSSLKKIGEDSPSKYKVPGTCSGILGKKKKTKQARKAWNTMVETMKENNGCKELKDMEEKYAQTCGMKYDPKPKGGCEKIEMLLLDGGTWLGGLFGKSCIHSPTSRKDGSLVTQEVVDNTMKEMLKSDIPGIDSTKFME